MELISGKLLSILEESLISRELNSNSINKMRVFQIFYNMLLLEDYILVR